MILKKLKKIAKKSISYILPNWIRYISYSNKVPRYNYDFFKSESVLKSLDLSDFFEEKGKDKSSQATFGKDLEYFLLSKTVSEGLLTYLFSNNRVLEQYARNQLQIVPGGPTISFAPPFPWSANPTKQSYHTRALHFLGYLVPLLEEAQKTNDRKYLTSAEDIFLDWLHHNPYLGEVHFDAWYEGSVVHRIGTLLEFLKAYSVLGPSSRISIYQLLAAIYQHVSHLYFNRDKLYKLGNHGLRQDIVLIISSYVFPYFKKADEWRQVGILGLETQLKDVCSQEGIWLEHSPGYQVYVDQWLWYLFYYLRQNKLPVPPCLIDYFKKSDEYMTHMVMPDGNIPQVGDTSNIGAVKYLARDCSAETRYAISGGTEGRKPSQLDKVFTDAGQAILRDTWGDNPEAYQKSLYIFIHSAQHLPRSHRHEDALSFLVYYNARPWIIDPGRNLLNLDKQFKTYFESAVAHNTYIIDGESIPPRKNKDLPAKLSSESIINKDIALLKAISYRFKIQAEVTRYYILIRQHKILFVFDSFQANKEVNWQSLLHFSPDLELSKNNHSILVQDPKDKDVTLNVSFEHNLPKHSIEIVRGSESPLMGWAFDLESRSIQPTSTLVINQFKRQGYGLIALHWCKQNTSLINSLSYEVIKEKTYRITWTKDENIYEVLLVTEPSLDIKYNMNS